MVTNMLKAISKMLEDSKEIKAICAKVMLDEIINGMEHPSTSVSTTHVTRFEPALPPKQKKEYDGGYKIEVNVDKTLKWIRYENGKELEGEKMLVVDGIQKPYAESIGKKFKSITVVEEEEG